MEPVLAQELLRRRARDADDIGEREPVALRPELCRYDPAGSPRFFRIAGNRFDVATADRIVQRKEIPRAGIIGCEFGMNFFVPRLTAEDRRPRYQKGPAVTSGGKRATATITPISAADIPVVKARAPAVPAARARTMSPRPTSVLDEIS